MKDFGKSIRELQTMAGESQENLQSISKALLEIASSIPMRAHKYRVWYHGKMIYKSLKDILVDSSNNFMFLDGEVTESTELQDEDGKEIYEGDIVQMEKYYGADIFNGIVFFENGCFWVREYLSHVDEGLYDDREKETCWSINLEWKIIGNIYENPDLLER